MNNRSDSVQNESLIGARTKSSSDQRFQIYVCDEDGHERVFGVFVARDIGGAIDRARYFGANTICDAIRLNS